MIFSFLLEKSWKWESLKETEASELHLPNEKRAAQGKLIEVQ